MPKKSKWLIEQEEHGAQMKPFKEAMLGWFVANGAWDLHHVDQMNGVTHESLRQHLQDCGIESVRTQTPELGTEYGYDSIGSNPPQYPCLETFVYCTCGEIDGRRMAMTSVDMSQVIYEVVQEGLRSGEEDAKGDPG